MHTFVTENSSMEKNIFYPESDFIKPQVEEIIATEETPDPNENPIVEDGDDPKDSWQTEVTTGCSQ